ncbi:winged helix-turn-helix transcriptional regulator [Streptosporangium sp. NBC_01756]|uniref:winged helix-turn-helix transcriptional regulator n=1 Tax=Streptosporangium sp. NBC_01756 TaxID=2975950 RepID=UPI002DD88220|nr:helix-turn-helix domain-containing protein [Streptosporangium sp. NBC_01756]WSC89512.1 helix-turn-helix transcriptional regulator [Streptosporangium sp. NBC_01756]
MSQRNTAVTDQLTAPTDASSPEDCPLPEVLALIGDKWSAQVMVQLGEGPHRFTQLERAIEGISRRMLTVSLRNLERNGLITRTVYPDSPPRVEYATTALVEDIRAPLEALAAWARHAGPVIAAARHAYDNCH